MKKFVSILLTLVLLPLTPAYARVDMDSIDLEVTLHGDGSASVRETRSFYTDEGTENFISMGNMGETDLYDVKVFDEAGRELERVEPWNVEASREEKAGKYGVIKTGDGYEICYGFGDYGDHTFVTEYKLSNFVFNLEDDYQAFYWKFLNDGMNPTGSASVKVYNDIGLIYEYPSTRIWGFGYSGQTQIDRDHLTAYTEESMSSDNYMVLLSIFEGKPFNTSNNQAWTSEDLIDQAMAGASPGDGDQGPSIESNPKGLFETLNDMPNKRLAFFFLLSPLITVFVPFLLFILLIRFIKSRKNSRIKIAKRNINLEDLAYYREIPLDDFAKSYELTNARMAEVLSAYLLKWIFEGRLIDQKEETGLIFKKDRLSLVIQNIGEPGNKVEEKLWKMVLEASGDDQVLSEKEFTKYIQKHYSRYEDLEDTLSEYSQDYLEDMGAIEVVEEKVLGLFKTTRIVETEEAHRLQENIYGFKRYLQDFSLLPDREVGEVKLWKDYLVWAAYFGIAEKVYDQLKIVEPDLNLEYGNMDLYTIILLTNNFSNHAQSTYTNATSSSGGGGSSFSGGGGGSFGGGSGGGIR